MLKKLLLAAIALLPVGAFAQTPIAIVVDTCGVLATPFLAGRSAPLTVDTTGTLCKTGGGGSGSPGGSNTQVQFNAAGSFGGTSGLTATTSLVSAIKNGFQFKGVTSGNTLVNATDVAGTTTLTLPAATDTLVGKATTDIFTNKTYDTAGAGNSFSINGTAVAAVTGTGSVVLATSPTLITPVLGTVAAGSILTNATGLPVSTGVTGLGAGVATFLGTPTSTNLASALTDETGTAAAVFANTPTLVTPVLGVATATSINKMTITAPATSSTLAVADGKTLTASNTLTLTGTDGTTMTFPNTSGTVTTLGLAQTITATKTFTAATSSIDLGATGGNVGIARLFGNTSGSVTLTVAAAAGTGTIFQLPATNGANTNVLQTDGAGVTSWVAAGAGGTPGGSNTQIQYNNSSAFGGISGVTSDGSKLTLATLSPGTVGAPTLNFNTSNTGIYSRSANIIDFALGGTAYFEVGNSGAQIGPSFSLGAAALTATLIRFSPISTGVLDIDDGGGSLNRIQLGGTTSSFPAIKRSSAVLAIRLADDSADAAITMAGATLSGQLNVTAMTQTAVAQSGTVCYNSGTGAVTYDSSVGCLTSSMRFKHAWEPLVGSLDKVMRLDAGTFYYNDPTVGGGGRQLGLNAENMLSVVPELVGYTPSGELLGVRYQNTVGLLVGAIQDLQHEIESLRARE